MSIIRNGVLLSADIVLRPASLRQQYALSWRLATAALTFIALISLSGCGVLQYVGLTEKSTETNYSTATLDTTYQGSVSADDPQVTEIGRAILHDGGRAGDAAAAMGLALTVSLPSRAGLDGGGICLAYSPVSRIVEEIDFIPAPITGPIQIPGTVAGLAVLQAHYGLKPWKEAVGRAEVFAERGVAVTPLLLADLKTAGLAGSIKLGDVLPQRAVATTLSQIRIGGPREIYTGDLAAQLVSVGVPGSALAIWSPVSKPAVSSVGAGGLILGWGSRQIFVTDNEGGKQAVMALQAMMATKAKDSAASVVSIASTSFVVSDVDGGAVGCSLTMGQLFGTGRVIPGVDIYAAAPLDQNGAASLVASITLLSGSSTVDSVLPLAAVLQRRSILPVQHGRRFRARPKGQDAKTSMGLIARAAPIAVFQSTIKRAAALRLRRNGSMIDNGSTSPTLKQSRRGQVPPFIAMDVMAAANRLAADGADIIHLEVGQPSVGAPAAVMEAASRALRDRQIGYTEAKGLPALRERIAKYYAEQHRVPVDPAQIIVTTGASGAFVLGFLAAFDAGDRVAAASPGYPSYRHILHALSIDAVDLPSTRDDHYQPSLRLLDALTVPIDGLIIASPSNPAGTALDAGALGGLLDWARAKKVRVVSDEIYQDIAFGAPLRTALSLDPHAIIINSFSKYFAMTGWRLGWIVVPRDLMRTLECLGQNLFISPPTLSQYAAIAAFDCRAELDLHVRRYAENRALLLDGLPKIGINQFLAPDGAFYIYADISHLTDDSIAFCQQMLLETGVAMTPGVDFDALRGHRTVRISFSGATDRIEAALERLKGWPRLRPNEIR